ncbi:MAG: Nramp family divalent metal transporter [Caldisericaceae bacterium]
MSTKISKLFENHKPKMSGVELLRYIGPGFLVTVGFIDPGNWAANVAAGSTFGYKLLWMVTLSTILLIILQHNVAHLGIVTGLCLSEASTKFYKPIVSRTFLGSAMLASVSTALAELLGASIGLKMLFKIPLQIGVILSSTFVLYMLFTNSYRKIEKWIIGFVGLIGLSFIFELFLVNPKITSAISGWFVPGFPSGSTLIIMSVLGAVVMPHNLFLHSEIIQSREWNIESEEIIKKQLRFEFTDTLLSMIAGWAINSAMIIVAAEVFFSRGIVVTELETAQATLIPLLGNLASTVFALALLFAGLASSITAGMAAGSIFAGIFSEPFDIHDNHSRLGVLITILSAMAIVFFLKDTYNALIISQVILSIQLPWTILAQITLTGQSRVMGKYKNAGIEKWLLYAAFAVVSLLNILLLINIRNF